MQDQVVETKYARYWVEDGIMNIAWHSNLVITLDIAKEMIEERLSISTDKTMPYLIDIRGLASVDTASRKYFAGKRSVTNVSAGALLVGSLISKLAGNIYIQVDRPLIPVKLFTIKGKAMAWLENYK